MAYCTSLVGQKWGVTCHITNNGSREDQVEMLMFRLKESHDRQKNYADKRCKDLEFQVGNLVYLKKKHFREDLDSKKA